MVLRRVLSVFGLLLANVSGLDEWHCLVWEPGGWVSTFCEPLASEGHCSDPSRCVPARMRPQCDELHQGLETTWDLQRSQSLCI